MIAAIYTAGGGRIPVVMCDECHEVIEDFDLAMAVMPASEGTVGEIQQVLHVHKAICYDLLETRQGMPLPWMELQEYLLLLNRPSRIGDPARR